MAIDREWMEGNLIEATCLVVGFPVVLLILNELILRAERKNRPIGTTFRILRNLVAPSLALLLFLRYILKTDPESTPVRLVETGFWIFLLIAVLALVNDVVFRSASPGNWRERVPSLFRDLARVALVCLGAAIIYSQVWGQEIQGALTALGIGGIVIGLALQEPMGNIVSGLMLLFERPFNIGDWITADGVTGKVIEINWRSVHIETSGNELRIVPNVSLYKGAFSNLSRPTPLRSDSIEIGFSYDHPPNKVKEVLLKMVKECPGVLTTPGPLVRTATYGDSSITYKIIYSVRRQEEIGSTKDQVLTRLWYAANRNALHIPYPITSQIELKPDDLPRARLPDIRTQVESIPLLRGRTAKVLNWEGARIESYAKGEKIVEESQPFDGLFLILQGRAALSVNSPDNQSLEFGQVTPGDYFGEYGVTAGQKSEMSIQALTDLEVVVLKSQTVMELFEQNPRVANEIGNTIEARRKAMIEARKARI